MPLTYWEKLINFYYKLIVGTSGAANPEIQNLATKLLTVTLKLSSVYLMAVAPYKGS
ncbi:hypothetical protein PtB15_8B224 [Puccinia triticina]|nr:hypothetical protein PtB15_8B224 [Puccinia triticina]